MTTPHWPRLQAEKKSQEKVKAWWEHRETDKWTFYWLTHLCVFLQLWITSRPFSCCSRVFWMQQYAVCHRFMYAAWIYGMTQPLRHNCLRCDLQSHCCWKWCHCYDRVFVGRPKGISFKHSCFPPFLTCDCLRLLKFSWSYNSIWCGVSTASKLYICIFQQYWYLF